MDEALSTAQTAASKWFDAMDEKGLIRPANRPDDADALSSTLYRLLVFLFFMLFPLMILGQHLSGGAGFRALAGPPRWAFDTLFLVGFVLSLVLYTRLNWKFFRPLFGSNWSYGAAGLVLIITAHAIAQAYSDQIIMQLTKLDANLFANAQRLFSLVLTAMLLLHIFIVIILVHAISIPIGYFIFKAPPWLLFFTAMGAFHVATPPFGFFNLMLLTVVFVVVLAAIGIIIVFFFATHWDSILKEVAASRKLLAKYYPISFGEALHSYFRLALIVLFLGVSLFGSHDLVRARADILLVQSSFIENTDRPYAHFLALGMSFPMEGRQCRNIERDTWFKFVNDGTDNYRRRSVIIAYPRRDNEHVGSTSLFSFTPAAQRFRFSHGFCYLNTPRRSPQAE